MKALVVTLGLLVAAPALAANADTPNRNVDKSNDAGGPTGNDKVDQLNKGQLDENQRPAASSQDAPTAQPPASQPR
jgi:hypothetical protein